MEFNDAVTDPGADKSQGDGPSLWDCGEHTEPPPVGWAGATRPSGGSSVPNDDDDDLVVMPVSESEKV
jgi:hypothetical protein